MIATYQYYCSECGSGRDDRDRILAESYDHIPKAPRVPRIEEDIA